MLLYIIRHGDPIYDPDSLTPKGHLQAKALAKRLALHGLDKIYASPLKRAQQTAQPTCDLLGKEMQIEEWTSERIAADRFCVKYDDGHWGWIFHQHVANLRNDESVNYSVNNWYESKTFTEHPEKDFKAGYEDLIAASDEFLAKHGYKREGAIYKITEPNEERVAVFCHQGFGTAWLSHLLSVPPQIFWSSFDISHTGVTILNFRNNTDGITAPLCVCMSDLSHIYSEGLPYEFNNYIKL